MSPIEKEILQVRKCLQREIWKPRSSFFFFYNQGKTLWSPCTIEFFFCPWFLLWGFILTLKKRILDFNKSHILVCVYVYSCTYILFNKRIFFDSTNLNAPLGIDFKRHAESAHIRTWALFSALKKLSHLWNCGFNFLSHFLFLRPFVFPFIILYFLFILSSFSPLFSLRKVRRWTGLRRRIAKVSIDCWWRPSFVIVFHFRSCFSSFLLFLYTFIHSCFRPFPLY